MFQTENMKVRLYQLAAGLGIFSTATLGYQTISSAHAQQNYSNTGASKTTVATFHEAPEIPLSVPPGNMVVLGTNKLGNYLIVRGDEETSKIFVWKVAENGLISAAEMSNANPATGTRNVTFQD